MTRQEQGRDSNEGEGNWELKLRQGQGREGDKVKQEPRHRRGQCGDRAETSRPPARPSSCPEFSGDRQWVPTGWEFQACPSIRLACSVTVCLTLKSSKVAHIHPGLLHTQRHTGTHRQTHRVLAGHCQHPSHRPVQGQHAHGLFPNPHSSLQTLGTKLPRARRHRKASLAGARGRVPLPRALLSPAAVIAAVFIQTRRGVAEKDFEE